MSPKRGISLGDWRNPYGGRIDDEGVLQHSIPGVQGGNSTTILALVADQVLYFPMVVDHAIQVDQFMIRVTSAGAASSVARLGIYHADNTFQPLALVVDAGTVLVDSTGDKLLAISPAELLPPGRYVMAINTDDTPSLIHIQSGIMGWGGVPDVTVGNMFVQILSATQTFAAFPNPGTQYTAAGIGNAGFSFPMFLRVSAS